MRCPICNSTGTVGKLFQVYRSNKLTSLYFCSTCSVEFRTQGQEVFDIAKVKANGSLKKIC